jgi:hypothetical protein
MNSIQNKTDFLSDLTLRYLHNELTIVIGEFQAFGKFLDHGINGSCKLTYGECN